MLTIFFLLSAISIAIHITSVHGDDSHTRVLTYSSRYAPLKKLAYDKPPKPRNGLSYNTIIRPTNLLTQRVIEVEFNNIPRYLLLDTGSADTWMISSHFQCLNSKGSPVKRSQCRFSDPYTGVKIPQTGNQTYYQVYGTGEIFYGDFGYANVTVAGLTVEKQKVALVNRGYGLGDGVRSGVIGLSPRSITRLYESTKASNSAPDGRATTYKPIFENMYRPQTHNQPAIAPFFSLALQRGDMGGYIAFGGLPPVKFAHDFVFTPFRGVDYYGRHDPGRYYPIQLHGFEVNGKKDTTQPRVIIDSGTAPNRLPEHIANQVNAAFKPPATYDADLHLFITTCNATAPKFGLAIGNRTITMNPKDMFLPPHSKGRCATSITKGFDFDKKAYPEGFYVLGDAFLNGVIAVFDAGAGGMWFAEHDY